MTLPYMQYFVCICDMGSTSKAAEVLHVSQSALSQTIKNLEQEYHVSLFTRTSKGLIPTEAGLLLKRHCQQVLQSVSDMEREMKELVGREIGTVNLGVSTMLSGTVAPQVLACVMDRLKLNLSLGNQFQLMKEMDAGRVDFVISILEDVKSMERSYRLICLGHAPPLVLCISESNPIAGKENPTLEELLELPLIRMNNSHHISKIFDNLGKKPNYVVSCNLISAVQGMIRQDIGVGFLGLDVARSCPGIRYFPVNALEPVDIYLICRPGVEKTRAGRDFLSLMHTFQLDV